MRYSAPNHVILYNVCGIECIITEPFLLRVSFLALLPTFIGNITCSLNAVKYAHDSLRPPNILFSIQIIQYSLCLSENLCE